MGYFDGVDPSGVHCACNFSHLLRCELMGHGVHTITEGGINYAYRFLSHGQRSPPGLECVRLAVPLLQQQQPS